MREALHTLVTHAATTLAEAEGKAPPAPGGVLYGADGVFDSIALVAFIVAVEQALEQTLGLTLVLADEKAMSQRKSPFRSVEALVEHIEALHAEHTSHAA
jgi:acyl carrier protein